MGGPKLYADPTASAPVMPVMHIAGMSFVIVFREGLEALVILAAMATYVIRAGQEHRLTALLIGAVTALLAGGLLAWFFAEALTQMSDFTEAILLAIVACMLVYVSAWLWRLRNLVQWQTYIERHVTGALKEKSSFLLGLIAFICVFRECAETIIFLRMLHSDETGATAAMTAGVLAALTALLVCYLMMRTMALRLPVRRILSVTSLVLFILALHFAGEVVHHLQVAGLLPTSMVRLPALVTGIGIQPTSQALWVQGAIVVLASILLLLTPDRERDRP
jgi:high-affinity iron transporter